MQIPNWWLTDVEMVRLRIVSDKKFVHYWITGGRAVSLVKACLFSDKADAVVDIV